MFGWGEVHFGGHIVAVGVCSEPVVAHLLVRDNFVYRNSVLSDDGQQIIVTIPNKTYFAVASS